MLNKFGQQFFVGYREAKSNYFVKEFQNGWHLKHLETEFNEINRYRFWKYGNIIQWILAKAFVINEFNEIFWIFSYYN